MGHVRMMGAIQPFLSGAISKTVNMPEAATAEEIERVYIEGWKLGLKAIAIYRDNSKRSQPLSTGKKKDEGAEPTTPRRSRSSRKQLAKAQVEAAMPHRRRLPAERTAVTHKFDIAGHEGYITVGLYPDGQPGEIFLKMAKEGSTVSGLMDTLRDDRSAWRSSTACRCKRPRQQVRPRPVRALGLHRQPGDPDRQVDRGLHLPLARLAVPVGRRQGGLGLIDRTAVVADVAGVAPGLRHCRSWPSPAAPADAPRPRRCRYRRPAGRARQPATETDAPKATAVAESPAEATTPAGASWRSSPPTATAKVTRPTATARRNGNGGGVADHAEPRRPRRSASRPRPTPPAAPNAARSWSATAAATSASTAGAPPAAAEAKHVPR